jgi:3-phosphoshikimate 1-carboxyvinyltransferase
MIFKLKAKTHSLNGTIQLPASKSISNRILIIRALASTPFPIDNLSEADDTIIMKQALDRNDIITDVGPAGTAMRFLTALFASQPGEKILTGSERMKQRPIAVLVDALRSLGANITYIEKEGYPPLRIEGRRLSGAKVTVAGDISSQYITALMLIAPTLPQPLEILIQGDPLSRPYIIMTQKLMQRCGAQVEFDGNTIKVKPGRYRSSTFTVEQDWSAAAFWMNMALSAKKSKLLLSGLTADSIQGDTAALELFSIFGLESNFVTKGLEIKKTNAVKPDREWNFRNHPDLVQPAAVTASILGLKFRFSGLDNLRLKETDRIAALQTELEKVGITSSVEDFTLILNGEKLKDKPSELDAHDDHRMVMSLTGFCLHYPELVIRNPMVVNKSYPGFWSQIEKFVDVRPGK